MTCPTPILSGLSLESGTWFLRSCQTGTWCVKKWANGGTCRMAVWGGTLPIFLWVVFRWFMSVPSTGSRWCGAKSIHRSFASHPAAGALRLVPGAHATVEREGGGSWGGAGRQEWMWSAAVPLSTSAEQSLLCLQVRYNASVQGYNPPPPIPSPLGQRSNIPLWIRVHWVTYSGLEWSCCLDVEPESTCCWRQEKEN